MMSGFIGRFANRRAAVRGPQRPRWKRDGDCVTFYAEMASPRSKRQRAMLDVRRRCLVCDWEEPVTEPEETDVLGPPCSRCHAPTERTTVVARRLEDVARNPHAAALGRLGGQRGGPARAAALSPRRRRDIARAAARARWQK